MSFRVTMNDRARQIYDICPRPECQAEMYAQSFGYLRGGKVHGYEGIFDGKRHRLPVELVKDRHGNLGAVVLETDETVDEGTAGPAALPKVSKLRERAKAELDQLAIHASELHAWMDQLDSVPVADPCRDGDVLTFKIRYPGNPKIYQYSAVRAQGTYRLTGRLNGKMDFDWSDFVSAIGSKLVGPLTRHVIANDGILEVSVIFHGDSSIL